MLFFITVLHIIVAITLVVLILLQDSKGGGVLGVGGGGANSLLGATGAQTLFAKMTRWVAVLFAVTCLYLTYSTSQSAKSVIDGTVIPSATSSATPSESAVPAATTTDSAAAPAAATPATGEAATFTTEPKK
jgi:preprotein translocase subunit SecG